MIEEDQHIIYVSQAKVIVVIKEKQSIRSGFVEKKIVVTTRRCLFFQSLSNMINELEYEIISKKKQKDKKDQAPQKKRVSINEFPEHFFPIEERECKIVIDEEPSCIAYLKKLGLKDFIKSVAGFVILKNMRKMKFELLSFDSLKNGFRFGKAIVCSKAWVYYEKYCIQNKVEVNRNWVRLVSELVNIEKSVVLIDPQIFLTGSSLEIKSFEILINNISFAHTYQHRYSITNQQIVAYAIEFLKIFEQKTHSLIFKQTNLNITNFHKIISPRLKLSHLIHIDISQNQLTDQAFATLTRLARQNKRLSFINLSHNLITLQNITLFTNLLRITQVALILSLSHNFIDDKCLQNLEVNVIFPHNPPIEEFDLSFNKFSQFGAWRLFVGNQKFKKYHPYMNFIIYPIPFKKETFPQSHCIEYPTTSPAINFNLHSALVEQFEQESFMKHALIEVMKSSTNSCITMRKVLQPNRKLPCKKQEVYSILQMSNKIENFIYSPQYIESINEIAGEIAKFNLNLPPVTMQHLIKYLSDKLNEALFVRDHYAVKYIVESFQLMKLNYRGFMPRIEKLKQRTEIFKNKIENIMNFEVEETSINTQLDEMVREGLRLYLNDHGIWTIYYLKYMRDLWIEKLLFEKYNPMIFIETEITKKNISLESSFHESDLVIPYEFKSENKVDENFYLHPWKANYTILSKMKTEKFNEVTKFLETSTKREKFAPFFRRIEERVQFLTNQFNPFSFYQFRITYSDLKINCARLINIYNNITEKYIYQQIPNIARYKPINKQKVIVLLNQARFAREFHISSYPNLNATARKAGFFNYQYQFTKYKDKTFEKQVEQLFKVLNSTFSLLKREFAGSKKREVSDQFIEKLRLIIKLIRMSEHPDELKEEFYLKIISWKTGKNNSNVEIVQFLPFITMYLKPPTVIEKYIVASIIENKYVKLHDLPLGVSIESEKAIEPISALEQHYSDYVERNWMSSNKQINELLLQKGKMKIQVKLLTNETFQLMVAESMTVVEVVDMLKGLIKSKIDFNHHWLYLNSKSVQKVTILEECQYIGEIYSEVNKQDNQLIFKRRIFSPQLRYIYKKNATILLNDLYYEVRHEYLLGNFYSNQSRLIEITADMIIIDILQKGSIERKSAKDEVIMEEMKSIHNFFQKYIPFSSMQKVLNSLDIVLIALKNCVQEKVANKQHNDVMELKKNFLFMFEDTCEFLSSTYMFLDRNKEALRVSVNIFFINVESLYKIEKVEIEKIISVVPMTKFLLIQYHLHETKIGKFYFFGEELKILATAQDLLTYFALRIKVSGPSLQAFYNYESLMNQHVRNSNETSKQMLLNLQKTAKKLQNASPTVLETENIFYFHPNRYVKILMPRKLYPNLSRTHLSVEEKKSEKVDENVLDVSSERKEQSEETDQLLTQNVFNTLFPRTLKLKEQFPYQPQPQPQQRQSYQQSFEMENSEDQPTENKDTYLSIYDKIQKINDVDSNQPSNSNSSNQQNQQKSSNLLKEPPLLPSNLTTPIKKQPEQQFEPITTAQKTKPKGPPKKNR